MFCLRTNLGLLIVFSLLTACVQPVMKASIVKKSVSDNFLSLKLKPAQTKVEQALSCYPIITIIPIGWHDDLNEINYKICKDSDTIYDAKYTSSLKGFIPIFALRCLEIEGSCEVVQ